jgi:hypothetical protein
LTPRKRGRKPNIEAPPGFARFSEAIKLFEPFSENAFTYRVRMGDIKVEEDEKGKMYEVRSIISIKDALQEEEQKIKERKQYPAILIDWSSTTDVPAGLRLAQQLYGPDIDIATAAVYQSWRKNNNYISMAVFSPDRKECYAALQIIPLAEEVIIDILSGKRKESSIQPDEIRSYDDPGQYNLLVTNAAVLPDRPLLLFQLLHRYMDFWVEQYPKRYIKRVYAQAASERGIQLIQHFFMAPRLDLAYDAYMIDLAIPSASKIVQRFKQNLERKAPLPKDLQWKPEQDTDPSQPIESTT